MAQQLDPKIAAWIKELLGFDVNDPKHLKARAQELRGQAIVERQTGHNIGPANPDELAAHVHKGARLDQEAHGLEAKAASEQKRISKLESEFANMAASGGKPVKKVTVQFEKYKSHEGFERGHATATFSNTRSGNHVKRVADIEGGELTFLDLMLEPAGTIHLSMSVPHSLGAIEGRGSWSKVSDHMIFVGHQDGRDSKATQQHQNGGKTSGSSEQTDEDTTKHGVNVTGNVGNKHTGTLGGKVAGKEDVIVEGVSGEVNGSSSNERSTGLGGGYTYENTGHNSKKDGKAWERTSGTSASSSDSRPERGFGFALVQVR